MLKRLSLIIILITTILIGSCTDVNIEDSNFRNHIETMAAFDTYGIKVVSSKTNTGIVKNQTQYVYIDNAHNTFLLSGSKKDDVQVMTEDVVFSMEADLIYSYVFNDVWGKYEVSSKYKSIRYFEQVLFTFFDSVKRTETNFETVYEDFLTLDLLKNNLINILGEDFDDDVYSLPFPVTAVYSKVDDHFTSIQFDLSSLYKISNQENEEFSSRDASWTIDFEFIAINEPFQIQVSDFITDDHYDDFTHLNVIEFDELYSYELIEGTVDYQTDKDILKVIFDHTGLYQLMLRDISSVEELFITILDENERVVRNFTLSAEDDISKYWNFAKGTYYIVVSGDIIDSSTIDYSFLFITN
jgi:hypothetical protein